MERRFATLGDGCVIAYRLDGPREAPVLALSNSLGTRLEMWEPQMEAFTKAFRVLRYDSRGHGASASPPGAYSMDRLGRDVVELADILGVASFDFCGLSKGGMVGQWLGVRAGDRVRRLVLANTAAYMGPPASWQSRIDGVRESGMAPLAQASLARWFTEGFRARAPQAVDAIRRMLLDNDPAGYAGCCAAIRDMDQRPTARLIACPTLVIGGTVDPSTPLADAAFLADSAMDARLVALEAAHLSNVEQPDAFGAATLDFLAG